MNDNYKNALVGCVYVVTNLVNNKKYVGKAIGGITGRKRHHLRAACKGSKLPLHLAISKYGQNNFTWESVFCSNDNETLFATEMKLIRKLRTRSPNGYNLTDGGEGRTGFVLSEKTKKKIGRSFRGKKLSEQHKMKIRESTKRTMSTKEYRLACSLRHKGRKWKPHQKKRFALTKMGDLNPSKRPEVARKISEALTGRRLTEEHKRKVALAGVGRVLNDDSRKKISDAKKGIPLSKKHRESLRTAWVQRKKNILTGRSK